MTGEKGLETEELVRAYFLRAGFFVMRGLKVRSEGTDLTDIDIWIYERSATLARRRTVIDVKDKKAPQAAERIFFIKGVAELLGVEGAGVATTDTRAVLRNLARAQRILWIDGADLQRLKGSDIVTGLNRISEEQMHAQISAIDQQRSGHTYRDKFEEMKSAVASKFGPSSANTALDGFQMFAAQTLNSHPGSSSAVVSLRLAYFAASIVAASFDFFSSDGALRPVAERVQQMTEAVRFGSDIEGVKSNLRWAEAAVREYLPNGAALAQTIRKRFSADVEGISAEALAEILVSMTRNEQLFSAGRMLESASYARDLPGFDALGTEAKALLGALLDFCNLSRAKFAKSWSRSHSDGSRAQNDADNQTEGRLL